MKKSQDERLTILLPTSAVCPSTLTTRRIYKYTKNYKVNDLDNDDYEN